MVRSLLTLTCLLVIPAVIVLAADEPVTEPIPLLLWASSDPAEDKEVSKINPVKFFNFLEDNREQFANKSGDIIGLGLFLSTHGQESGTEGTLWPAVLAKIAFKKATGITEEKEHGLPSLVAWAMRNTGPGTSNPSIDRKTLVEFIFYHKTGILKLLTAGDVDGLVAYFDGTKSESGTKKLDWKSIITDLKDNRQLFKYACGFLGLQLCDRTKAL